MLIYNTNVFILHKKYFASYSRHPRPNAQSQQSSQAQLYQPSQQQQQQRYQPPVHQPAVQPINRVLPSGIDNTANMGYQPVPDSYRNDSHPNYQNIGFSSGEPQPPPVPQPPSEYDAYDNQSLKAQGFQVQFTLAQPLCRNTMHNNVNCCAQINHNVVALF